MKQSRNPLYQAVQYALVPGAMAGIALSSSPVFAQVSEEEAAEMDRVQVTGSRISRIDIEGANPVTVLDRDDIKRTGMTDIGEIVQDLPMMSGSPISSQRNNGGSGRVAVDIDRCGNETLAQESLDRPDIGLVQLDAGGSEPIARAVKLLLRAEIDRADRGAVEILPLERFYLDARRPLEKSIDFVGVSRGHEEQRLLPVDRNLQRPAGAGHPEIQANAVRVVEPLACQQESRNQGIIGRNTLTSAHILLSSALSV